MMRAYYSAEYREGRKMIFLVEIFVMQYNDMDSRICLYPEQASKADYQTQIIFN